MKVNELSEITGVGIETIRKYRNQGLLFPRKLSNGYYDYSRDELIRLLYIRKLRGSGTSLGSIRYTTEHDDLEKIYQTLRGQAEELDARIRDLTTRRELLEMTLQHFEACRSERSAVSEWEVEHESRCIPLELAQADPEARPWFSRVELTALTILLDMTALQSGTIPEWIPYEIGLAAYAQVLEHSGVPIPEYARQVPRGTYLAMWLEPERSDAIRAEQLRPMLAYAKAHGYRFLGPCSGFIYRVERSRGENRALYRFRAQVERIPGECSSVPRQQHLHLPGQREDG